jgi:diguanylate cyclase (GGDEF)-like protein
VNAEAAKTTLRRSFATRIVVAFLLVLALAQVATLLIVDVAVDRNVHRQLGERLEVGERVWRQGHADQLARLQQSVSALAADFAFREAVATGDASTALSALVNHGARIGASPALLLAVDGSLLTSTAGDSEGAQTVALQPLLARARQQGDAAGLAVLDGRPHNVALVPVLAPRLIGWVAMGRPLDAETARNYRALTGLDAAFVSPQQAGWKVHGSSLGDEASGALTERGKEASGADPVALGGRNYYLRRLEADNGGESPVSVLLLADIDAALLPYQRVKRQILLLATLAAAVAMLVAAFVGRGVTRPVSRLARAARRVGQGDYAEPLEVEGNDELTDLATAFNRMQENISEREARIRHQASHDSLTGLPNRNHALAALQSALERAHAESRTCAVLMLDLDHFKEINDTLGHDFGDRVLCVVSDRLRNTVRGGDLLARLGGDEFIVLLEGADERAAVERAWHLVHALDDPLRLGDDQAQVSVNVSIGVAVYPEHAGKADALLRRADIAMYEAKQAHARVGVYKPGHDELHLRQIQLISDLRRARERGELQLVYQPKIDLATRRVAHVEALLRWQHAELGSIPPDEFIPLAERSGLIHEITHHVLDEGLRQQAAWREDGIAVGMAINLSALDLVDAGLPATVADLLQRHGIPARDLILEITEGTVMRDVQAALRTMHALRAIGVKLSIDDFGTGHSSLAQLKSLPVDEIKIDRSFVMQLDHSPGDTVIVRSAIEIGHNMGLTVIAEGVEQAGSLAILRALQCDMVQGYLFSRPVAPDRFRDWYADFARDGAPCFADDETAA